jgi:hypothetical protein
MMRTGAREQGAPRFSDTGAGPSFRVKGDHMKDIQAVCDKCKKAVDAKPLLGENELWEALNKGDEIEVMHLADDVHHTWKLTGPDKDKLRKARAAGTV